MTQYFVKRSFLLSLMLACLCGSSAHADDLCNPMVEPVKSETSTAQILAGLAEKHNFTLSFPSDMDHPVRLEESMRLNELIKLLTADMNTVLLHEKIKDCSGPRLTELTVMPVGEDTEFIRVEQPPMSQSQQYEHIDNMEEYVTDVYMGERKAELKGMTPEQQAEYKAVKKRLRKDLKAEKQKNKKEQRKQERMDSKKQERKDKRNQERKERREVMEQRKQERQENRKQGINAADKISVGQ